MINHDIDVDYFSKRGLLTIFEVPDLMKHPKGVLKGSEDLVDELFYNINQKRPFLVSNKNDCMFKFKRSNRS